MQYTVHIPCRPDLDAVEAALLAVDPAALLDLDPAGDQLRIATWMTRDELRRTLARAGVDAGDEALVQLPSECCGGCGG